MSMNRAARTRSAIINSAEQLWAARGLDGVTLKEIMVHAGCANTTAIQYHFGNRDGLITAVFQDRLTDLEKTRSLLLAHFETEGRPLDLSAALYCLYVPIAELRDAQGNRSYAAFQFKLSLIHRLDLRYAANFVAPVTDRLIQIMRSALQDVDEADYNFRIKLASGLFWQALAILDAPQSLAPTRKPENTAIAEVLQVLETILRGPR